MNFSLLLDITSTKKLSALIPPLILDYILERKVSLIAFRQILPKILPAWYIFSNSIMANLKKLIGNKYLNRKQCPAGLSPRIISLHLYGKLWGWGRIPANNQILLIFPTSKILLDKLSFSTIKSVIFHPSNNSFHRISLYKLS